MSNISNPILLVSPAVNVIVTGLFTGMVLRQYLRRHRVYQLYWSIALSMAFLATLAYVFMLVVSPTSGVGILFFRFYYIFGGTLMPAWLGLGSVALVCSERVTRNFLSVLLFLSLVGAILVSDATIDVPKMSQVAGTPGAGILLPGPWLVMTILLNTLGVVAVVGVALYSGWKLLRRQSDVRGIQTVNLLWANVLILAGDLLNAVAGTLARFLGVQGTFWLIMAVGWMIFFSGVILTSRRSRPAQSPAANKDSVGAKAH